MLVENRFHVEGEHVDGLGERFVVARPPTGRQLLTRDEALNLAAHLVSLADTVDVCPDFVDVLDAVLEGCDA